MNKLALMIAMVSFGSFASDPYPDSTIMDSTFGLNINIAHKINGSIKTNSLVSTKYGAWSAWETSSYMHDCSPWSPDANTIAWGKQFIQTQWCSADETRQRDVTYTYANGYKDIRTEYEKVVTQVDDEQDAIGTLDSIIKKETTTGSWTNSGALYSCSSWSPSTSVYDQGMSFTQYSTCKQDQIRTLTYTNVWASGKRTSGGSTQEDRTIEASQSRNATGTKVNAVTKWIIADTSRARTNVILDTPTTVKSTDGTTYSNAIISEVKYYWDAVTMLPYNTKSGSIQITKTTADFSDPLIANSVVRCPRGDKAISTVWGSVSKSGYATSFVGGFDSAWRYDGCESSASLLLNKVELRITYSK